MGRSLPVKSNANGWSSTRLTTRPLSLVPSLVVREPGVLEVAKALFNIALDTANHFKPSG